MYGDKVGELVGVEVGARDGKLVGDKLGAGEGMVVGEKLGDGVGMVDGGPYVGFMVNAGPKYQVAVQLCVCDPSVRHCTVMKRPVER